MSQYIFSSIPKLVRYRLKQYLLVIHAKFPPTLAYFLADFLADIGGVYPLLCIIEDMDTRLRGHDDLKYNALAVLQGHDHLNCTTLAVLHGHDHLNCTTLAVLHGYDGLGKNA